MSLDRKGIVDGEAMFIRFFSGEIDRDSHVPAGLFCAAVELRWTGGLPDYEFEALSELRDWFDIHLKSPSDYMPRHERYDRAVCWFKSTATEHVTRAWQMATILERNGFFIWTIKSIRPGYVYYEDNAQVFAEPFAELRRLLTR